MKVTLLGYFVTLVLQESLSYGGYYRPPPGPYQRLRAFEGNYGSPVSAGYGRSYVETEAGLSDTNQYNNAEPSVIKTSENLEDAATLSEDTGTEETTLLGQNSEVEDLSGSDPLEEAIAEVLQGVASGLGEFHPDFIPESFTQYTPQPAKQLERYLPPSNYNNFYGTPFKPNPPPVVTQVTYHTARYVPQNTFPSRNSYELEYENLTEGIRTYQNTALTQISTSIFSHTANMKKAITVVLQKLAQDVTGENAYKLCGYSKIQLQISQAVGKFSAALPGFANLDAGSDYGYSRRNAYKVFRVLQDSLREIRSTIEQEYNAIDDEPLKHIQEIDDLIEEGIQQLTKEVSVPKF